MTGRSEGYVELSTTSAEFLDDDHGGSSQLDLLLPPSSSRPHSVSYGGSLVLHPDGVGYSYSYGPGGLAGLWYNRYALQCAVFASIGGLTFGYDQGVIANVLVMRDFMARWPIGPWEKGLMTAVLELGALFGALSAGLLADRYSRRFSILLASIIFCIGSAFQCGAQSLPHLVFGRAIGGIGVGSLSMLSPLYMAEISPPEVRGSLIALEQFAIVLGVVFGFWAGFFTRSWAGSVSWRFPLGIQILPGALLALGCLFLPASPRLLVLQGKNDEALKSLLRLRLRKPEEAERDALIQIELLEMRVEMMLVQRTVQADATKGFLYAEARAWARLFERRYLDRTLIGILVMFFQQWSGINALLYYGPTLIRSMGLRDDTVSLIVSGGIGIVQFIAVIPTILFIDKWGRKPLLRVGSMIMGCSHAVIALLVLRYENNWTDHSFAAWMAVACVYTFTAAYGVSFGPIGWVLPSEIFPLSMRSRGVAVSTSSNWINNFLIGLVTPGFMEISAVATFGIFASACFIGYLWSTYIVPETAQMSLEETDALFRSSAAREDMLLRRQIEDQVGLRGLIRKLV